LIAPATAVERNSELVAEVGAAETNSSGLLNRGRERGQRMMRGAQEIANAAQEGTTGISQTI